MKVGKDPQDHQVCRSWRKTRVVLGTKYPSTIVPMSQLTNRAEKQSCAHLVWKISVSLDMGHVSHPLLQINKFKMKSFLLSPVSSTNGCLSLSFSLLCWSQTYPSGSGTVVLRELGGEERKDKDWNQQYLTVNVGFDVKTLLLERKKKSKQARKHGPLCSKWASG